MAAANFCHYRRLKVSLPLVILLTNKNVTTNCRRLKQRQPAAAPPRRRRALRGTPRRAQRNGCLQNSNDSFQPQKQVLQSSTERFVFSEWWIRPCKIVLMCCYSDQKDFQNKSSVVLHYKLSFFWDEKSFSMNLQVTAYKKGWKKQRIVFSQIEKVGLVLLCFD